MSDLTENCIIESSEHEDSVKIPHINEYDKLFSQLLNMNLFNRKGGEDDGENEGEDNGENEGEDKGEDEGEDEGEYEGEDEGSDEGEDEGSDISLSTKWESTKWEVINKLVESHLNITNSVIHLLKTS